MSKIIFCRWTLFILCLLMYKTVHLNAAAGKSNLYDSFPVGIGKIMINDTQYAPQYKFKNASLATNESNVLVIAPFLSPTAAQLLSNVTPGMLQPLPGILPNLAAVTLADNDQFSIESYINPEKYYAINGTYLGGSTKMLTLHGGFQDETQNQWAKCSLQFNLFQLLQKNIINQRSSNEGVTFKWALINLNFDTYGQFLVIDSVDVYFTTYAITKPDKQGDNLLHIARIEKLPMLTTPSLNPLWNDRSIFNTDCITP